MTLIGKLNICLLVNLMSNAKLNIDICVLRHIGFEEAKYTKFRENYNVAI